MNIAQLVRDKFNNQSVSSHRLLTNDPVEGILGSGFILKTRQNCSNINLTTKSYHGVLLLSGQGVYKDDHIERPLLPGDFIQRFPDHTHSTIVTSDDWSELYVLLGKSIFLQLARINVLSDNQPVLSPGLDFETIQNFLNFHDQLNNTELLEQLLLVPQVITYLARINYLDKSNHPNTDEKNIISLATKFMQDNISQRITVDDVADHVNLGYEKFRKLFTNHYHLSPGNYMIHNRIFYSQKLLTNSALSIKEIAYQLGYADAYTFSKQFKKITGRSPSDFQQLYLN